MHKDLREAFEGLMEQHSVSEQEMIAAWLEFVADRARALADKK